MKIGHDDRVSSPKRSEIRQFKKKMRRSACAEAAEWLLSDSVKKGHDRLALLRYFDLLNIDAERCRKFDDYCRVVLKKVGVDSLNQNLRAMAIERWISH